MTQRSELEWRLVAKDSASRQVRAVDRAFDRLRKTAVVTKKALTGVLAIGAVGGTAAAGTLAYILKTSAEEMDKLGKSALRLGVGTESLAAFQLAAQLSGVEINALEQSLQRMVRRIGDSSRGFGSATQAFKELGLDARRLAELRPEEQFIAIKTALEGIESVNRRLSLGGQIFDSEGIKTLQISVDTLRTSVADVRESGLAVTREEVARIESMNDSVTRLETAWKGVKSVIAVELAPEVEAVVNEMREFLNSLEKEQIRSTIYAISDAFHAVRDEIEQINSKVRILVESIGMIAGDDSGMNSFNRLMRLLAATEDLVSAQEGADDRASARRERRARQEREITAAVAARGEAGPSSPSAESPEFFGPFDSSAPDRFRWRRAKPQLDSWWQGINTAAAGMQVRANAATSSVFWEQVGRSIDSAKEKLKDFLETPARDTYNATFEQIGDALRYNVLGAIDDAIDGVGSLSDALRNLGRDVLRIFLNQALVGAIGSTADGGSGLIGALNNALFSAKGNAFAGGKVQAFARGGVLSRPVAFNMGIAGEAGPEGILPLARTRNGDLGVRATGGGGGTVVQNNYFSTLDPVSFGAYMTTPEGEKAFRQLSARAGQRRF